jgi:hypothetical protein
VVSETQFVTLCFKVCFLLGNAYETRRIQLVPHAVSVLRHKVLKNVLGTKSNEITKNWRKCKNNEFYNVRYSRNAIKKLNGID